MKFLSGRCLPYTDHRRPGVDDEDQYPDSNEVPGVAVGEITRNRLQEAEGVERDTSEDLWEYPDTTDPWNIT